MPVQWLYVLQSGAIIAPDAGGSGTTATFVSSTTQPSASNPIVGRVAFWTDDETCKLNINTASEGTDYAFPHVNTNTEMSATSKPSGAFGYAISPPATGEYNRYPGHPATTCLSVALGYWLDGTYSILSGRTRTSGTASAPTAYTTTTNDTYYLGLIGGDLPPLSGSYSGLGAYTLLSPRVKMSGTVEDTVGSSLAGTVNESGSMGANAVQSGSDRLYASLDELVFRNPVASDSAGPRSAFPNPNLSGTGASGLRWRR